MVIPSVASGLGKNKTKQNYHQEGKRGSGEPSASQSHFNPCEDYETNPPGTYRHTHKKKATGNRLSRFTKGTSYLTNLADCFKERTDLMNKRRTVSVVYLGPPGSTGFDQQYKVQLTDIHQWCPSEVKTGPDTG